jgi:hypothetical protein
MFTVSGPSSFAVSGPSSFAVSGPSSFVCLLFQAPTSAEAKYYGSRKETLLTKL